MSKQTRPYNKSALLQLSDEQRLQLQELIRTGTSPARLQRRARLLLLADRSQGQARTDQAVAEALLCSKGTVGNVRRRFLSFGLLAALEDKPRPGQKPKLTGDIEAHLITLACSDPPKGEARWSLRLLADKLVELGHIESISHVSVGQRLKKMRLSLGKSRVGAWGAPRPGS